jgi:hypothetical protein
MSNTRVSNKSFNLPFQAASGKKLKDQFMADLVKNPRSSLLAEILKKNKQLKMNFCTNKLKPKIHMVMIQCSIDAILIKLAQAYNFPRGFPIIWIPGKMIKFFGFYPKFNNDDRQNPDDPTEFDHVHKISFFKKWSGFLGQLCAFEYEGANYWACSSKNRSNMDLEFVQWCTELYTPFVNDDVIQTLVDGNFHVCAEMMDLRDQGHGARVLRPTPVVTSLGSGMTIDLEDPDVCVLTTKPFVDFASHQKLVAVCTKLGLPCDSAISVEGESTAEFMRQLSAGRDFMTNSRFMAFLAKRGETVHVTAGNVEHKNILGDVLEGLVIQCFDADGKWTMTKKYKFPNYTCRTMSLRTLIGYQGHLGMIQQSVLKSFRSFSNYWCVSEAGKAYWLNFLCQCAIMFGNNEIKLGDIDGYKVGSHILVADQLIESLPAALAEKTTALVNAIPDYKTRLIELVKSTVVLVLGPIGSGKSSFANKLQKSIPKSVAIDGDVLDLTMPDVMTLRGERNDYTMWMIIKTLMDGKIPILSTGGGALFSFGRKPKYLLRTRIRNTLGIDVKIVAYVASDTIAVNPSAETVEAKYKDKASVVKTLEYRLRTGAWTLPVTNAQQEKIDTCDGQAKADKLIVGITTGFTQKIIKASAGNAKFATLLAADANTAYCFPCVTTDTYTAFQEAVIPEILIPTVVFDDTWSPGAGRFMQFRLLIKYPIDSRNTGFGHVTVGFNSDREIVKSNRDIDEYNTTFGGQKRTAHFVTLSAPEPDVGKKKVASPTFIMVNDLLDVHENNSAHVTVNPGIHAPVCMKTATIAMRGGEDTVTLSVKAKPGVVYTLADAVSEDIEVTIVTAFGI